MKHLRSILFVCFLFSSLLLAAQTQSGLKEKLESLPGVSGIELLESDEFSEKYLVRVTQLLDPHNPDAGTFTQRVVISHAGFDRPTVLITEGYGGEYAQRPNYREEVSAQFNTNMVHVEHRYFLESTPEPLDWKYLTAENSAYDLHHVTATFKQIYPGKWISTGISKGGTTTLLYRAWFPDDVDISVPYVAPLNKAVEDGRHEPFLRKVGTADERHAMEQFQKLILERRAEIVPMLEEYCRTKGYTFRISPDEVLDYCVLEYPFAMWQWGTSVNTIPPADSSTEDYFDHLVRHSSPDYFAENQPLGSFFVQAAGELGYYGYDTEPLRDLLSIKSSRGYLKKIMLPASAGEVPFDQKMYDKVYNYLKDNDPKMICIYGQFDPWSATRVPDFKGKKNLRIYIEPGGSHRTRIGTFPEKTRQEIIDQLKQWLEE